MSVLIYTVVGNKDSGFHQVFMDIPAFNTDEYEPNFYNLTNSFCTHLETSTNYEGKISLACSYIEILQEFNDDLTF